MNSSNPELSLAREYINETGCHLFLTGKAGTGKTTFLQTLKEDCPKRMVVTAPTGVAAINCGGVTLHSLFQLPFAPFLPDNPNTRPHYRFSKDKKALISSLDLLVIDEISMVRADVLDGVDDVLRRLRRNNKPFGGVQLLMIGDLFQLPPVVRNEDQSLLAGHYDSPYFFNSKALAGDQLATIELQKIYRQTDNFFIELLNKVRNNSIDATTLASLNANVQRDASADEESGTITLCSHNRQADNLNRSKLGELKTPPHIFEADIEGEFPEHTYPTGSRLTLKKGAQVMFIRNDVSVDKRFFNGKIGTITHISKDGTRVSCPGDNEEIEVEASAWENIEYKLNEDTQEITEKKIGVFRQYPLRLAWAITIHKSQGLTFDRAVIDAHSAFAHGQVYVALSRCRTFEGMLLSAPLSAKAIQTDPAVVEFSRQSRSNQPTAEQFEAARTLYQQRLMLECFDFQRLRSLLRRFVSLVLGNTGVIHISGVEDLAGLQQQTENDIITISANFQRQLRSLFSQTTPPAQDAHILDRLAKASVYFQEKITSILIPPLASLHIDTDNKELRKKTGNILKLLDEEVNIKLAAVQSCQDGFSPPQYFRAISTAAVNAQKSTTNKKRTGARGADATPTYSESDIAHPELFTTLKKWRSEKAESQGIPHFQVMHQKTLIQLVVHLPDSLKALESIKGIGPKLSERYGDELVAIIRQYRTDNNIEQVILPQPSVTAASSSESRQKGTTKQQDTTKDTRQQTLELFEQGLSISEIAQQRQLMESTIETHMACLVEQGQVAAASLLSAEKLEELQKEVGAMEQKPLRTIKEILPQSVTYGEIRIAQAHVKYLASAQKIEEQPTS